MFLSVSPFISCFSLSVLLSLVYPCQSFYLLFISVSPFISCFSLSVLLSLVSLCKSFYLLFIPVSLSISCFSLSILLSLVPRSGKLRTQKLNSHLVRTQSLNVLPLKPGVSQYIAIHATLTAMDFFLAYFYHSGPFTCIFPKPLPIFPVLAVANTWFLCRPAE